MPQSNIDPSLPLVDLHRHLEGSMRLGTILELAQTHGIPLPAVEPEALRPYVQAMVRQPGLMAFMKKIDLSISVLADLDASWDVGDFFVMPPSPGEVTARLRQVQSRDHRHLGGKKVIRAGDLSIDLERYEVFNRGSRVVLTFKEYQLLYALASNSGRVCTRESLLNRIWGYDYYGGTRTVDVHIRRLRSKLEDTDQALIETVWNVGYRFRAGDAPAPETG